MKKENLKIMVLVPSFSCVSPVAGAFLFVKYLKRQKIDVVFVSLDSNKKRGNTFLHEMEENHVEYDCLNISGWKGLLVKGGHFRNYCRKKKISVVVAYLLRPTLITSIFSPALSIVYVRGILRDDYNLAYGKFVSSIMFRIENIAIRKMDKIFSLTGPMTDYLVYHGVKREKIDTIKNCVDVKQIHSLAGKPISNKNEVIRIGIFCSLIPRKDVETAIKGFSLLIRDTKKPVQLHIAGDGNMAGKLKKMVRILNIEAHVVFHGHVSDSLGLMAKMDIVLLTSISEGLPRCLMEAMAMGKTIVASNIPGITDLINHKKTGFLFPLGNERELARLIQHIINEKAFIPADQLIEFMLENFDVNVQCGKMLNQIFSLEKITTSGG